jgi:hypothetical protein
MATNVEQTLSFTTQQGVTILLKKTGNDGLTQLTLQDVNMDGEVEWIHAYLTSDEERALLYMIEKI